MAALVVLRKCVSDRITRTRDAERQARSTSDAKLLSLTNKYSELQKTSQIQLEQIKRMEVSIVTLQESEKRLNEHVSSLETQREADREAASTLREKIAESAVLSQLADKLQDALSPMIDRDLVSIEKNDLWVEIELNSNMLFGSGNATLSDEALQVLWKVAKPIRKLNNAIQVEGFTDNIPINTFEYPSNWELSAARAASVVHLFTKYGVDPDRLAAVGYGQYHPIEDNETAEGRERNRRVVIVVQSNAISRFTEKKKTADNLDDGQRMVETTVNELSEAIDDPVSRVDSVTESREDLEKQRKLERARSSRFNKFLNQ